GRVEVARAGGGDVANLVAVGDRGAAVAAMGAGAEAVVRALHAQGRLDGIVALGGSGGSSIAARAMRALPVGVPKLLVSTVASGDTRPYVGAVDVTMMYSVVDIAGVNRVSARIMANAAGAISGMVGSTVPRLSEKPLVGTGPARGGGCCGPAAGRVPRRARHGQLRSPGHGAPAVRRAQSLRPQPDDHAHANDARGMRRARPHDRTQALGRARADRALRAAEGRLDDRRRGTGVLRRGGRR